MTWIRAIPRSEAGPPLAEYYEEVYGYYPPEYGTEVAVLRREDGGSDSIVEAHSLIPEAMLHAISTHGLLLSPDLPLSRAQHEMIATVVSALNRCFY
jgi:hypothetical protein